MLLAETNEGYHNLIKLVSSGYTEGFYYKPRIDKELLAQHAKGLIGLSSCLKGEVATGIRTEQQQKAIARGGRLSRHPRARATSSSRCSTRASTTSGSSTSACSRSRRISACSWSPPTTCTTCRTPTSSRTTSCCASAPARSVNDTERLRYHGDQFYLKTADEMAEVFADFPEALAQHGAASPSAATSTCPATVNHLPNFDVPAGFTLDDYFEHVVRAGLRAAAAAAAGARGARRRSSTRSTSTSGGSPTKSR